MKLHRLAVVGGGDRGKCMAKHALREPGRAKIVAVAEPKDESRTLFQKEFALEEKVCFRTHNELLESDIKVDGVFITTTPVFHRDTACTFLEAGIPIFLEKPMAANIDDAAEIMRIARKTETPIQIGFNCRYAPFFIKLKEIIVSGQLGKILSLEWKEVIAPHHWSNYCRNPSYNKRSVIGSWLLEKCCHDLDLMNWIIDSQCLRVASFGNRSYFNHRADVPKYCTENCPIEKECMFSAFKFHPELESNSDKLPRFYTLCVYDSNSDLVDHQSAILEYSNGVTVVFSLAPLIQEHQSSRFVYICGTKATLNGNWTKNKIRIFPHGSEEKIICDPNIPFTGEHGGGDSRIVSAFLDYLDDPVKKPKTGVKEGLESMVVGCGIDISLREHRVVELDALRNIMEQI